MAGNKPNNPSPGSHLSAIQEIGVGLLDRCKSASNADDAQKHASSMDTLLKEVAMLQEILGKMRRDMSAHLKILRVASPKAKKPGPDTIVELVVGRQYLVDGKPQYWTPGGKFSLEKPSDEQS